MFDSEKSADWLYKRVRELITKLYIMKGEHIPRREQKRYYEGDFIMAETTNVRCILNPKVAKKLIRAGHKLVDIKANKNNPAKTVFVFEATDEFNEFMKSISRTDAINMDVTRDGDFVYIGDVKYRTVGTVNGNELLAEVSDDDN